MIFIWDYRTLGKNCRKTSEKFKVKNRTLAKTARMRHPGSKTETPTCGSASCIARYPKARVLRARLRQHGKKGDRRAGSAGRGFAERVALLYRASSILEAGCGGSWGKKFGGGGSAGFISQRRAGNVGASRCGAGLDD